MAFEDLGKLAIMAVTVGMVLVVGFLIMTQVQSQAETSEGLDYSNATQCATSSVCNGSNKTIAAVATIPGWIGLVILIGIGSILIMLVKKFA